jgi:hypothetical protein
MYVIITHCLRVYAKDELLPICFINVPGKEWEAFIFLVRDFPKNEVRYRKIAVLPVNFMSLYQIKCSTSNRGSLDLNIKK